MAKGPWEERVGMLLDEPHFIYKHKCPDVGPHGGKVKIDWLACDNLGQFFMVEVKEIRTVQTVFHIDNEVTPLQQEALSAVGCGGISLVAVGHGRTANEHAKYTTGLYVMPWNWLNAQENRSVDMTKAPRLFFPWKGSKSFVTEQNKKDFWLWQQR